MFLSFVHELLLHFINLDLSFFSTNYRLSVCLLDALDHRLMSLFLFLRLFLFIFVLILNEFKFLLKHCLFFCPWSFALLEHFRSLFELVFDLSSVRFSLQLMIIMIILKLFKLSFIFLFHLVMFLLPFGFTVLLFFLMFFKLFVKGSSIVLVVFSGELKFCVFIFMFINLFLHLLNLLKLIFNLFFKLLLLLFVLAMKLFLRISELSGKFFLAFLAFGNFFLEEF